MPTLTDTYNEAVTLSAEPEDNFVKLGRLLLKLQVEGKDLFKQLIKESGLERRKAYYLAAIARQFDLVPIKDAQLAAIGWTRAQIISRYVTPRNWRELLELAQKHSAHDLKIAVSGDKRKVRGTRSVELVLEAEANTTGTSGLLCRMAGRWSMASSRTGSAL